MSTFIIAYDIADKKTLVRVHKVLSSFAVALEKSVFFCCTDRARAIYRLAGVASLINPKTDDLRCYELPATANSLRLGAPTLPEDIVLGDLLKLFTKNL